MLLPIPLFILLMMLAAPTASIIAAGIDSALRRRGLCLLGRCSRFGATHYVDRWCVLYIPLHTTRGAHSTALFD